MAYDFESIVDMVLEQHENIFPNATLETQVVKLGEELNELKIAESQEDKMGELGDVLYVVCSLLRFQNTEGVFNFIMDTLYHCKTDSEKELIRETLANTICKVSRRHNKGAYYWDGTHYKRDKTI